MDAVNDAIQPNPVAEAEVQSTSMEAAAATSVSSVSASAAAVEPAPPAVVLCSVCSEEGAKIHYGVLACLGCKGFFRRALKKVNEYECLRNGKCTIDKQERNSCRSCRLQKCLDVGMDPAAVRPDRDFTCKQQQLAARRMSLQSAGKKAKAQSAARRTSVGGGAAAEREEEEEKRSRNKLPVEMRTLLMTLQNIEAKVVRGDTNKDASEIYPLRINTIREVIDEPTKLRGLRTEMRYEPYRMARNQELSVIVYRRLIAAIDWVELLAERLGGLSTEDRIALVKACFGPLTLFKCSARTAVATKNEDLLCLCNFAYVPREISKAYSDAYHLDNGLVERLLNELVSPFRRIHVTEEEIICISAIIVLNPMARDLSDAASDKVLQLRNRICSTLFQIVKECRPECNPTSCFGNLLLFLPTIASLANAMSENLRFAQTFSALGGIPLLTSLFGCFPVEPFVESSETALYAIEPAEKIGEAGAKAKEVRDRREKTVDASTQTEAWIFHVDRPPRKRRLAERCSLEEGADEFRLLKAPCSYTLTEMFDDRINDVAEQEEDPPGEQQMAQQRFVAPPAPAQQRQRANTIGAFWGAHAQPTDWWTQQQTSSSQQQQQHWTPQYGASQTSWDKGDMCAPQQYVPTTQIQQLYLDENRNNRRMDMTTIGSGCSANADSLVSGPPEFQQQQQQHTSQFAQHPYHHHQQQQQQHFYSPPPISHQSPQFTTSSAQYQQQLYGQQNKNNSAQSNL